jgi:hypothetical protein
MTAVRLSLVVRISVGAVCRSVPSELAVRRSATAVAHRRPCFRLVGLVGVGDRIAVHLTDRPVGVKADDRPADGRP